MVVAVRYKCHDIEEVMQKKHDIFPRLQGAAGFFQLTGKRTWYVFGRHVQDVLRSYCGAIAQIGILLC